MLQFAQALLWKFEPLVKKVTQSFHGFKAIMQLYCTSTGELELVLCQGDQCILHLLRNRNDTSFPIDNVLILLSSEIYTFFKTPD